MKPSTALRSLVTLTMAGLAAVPATTNWGVRNLTALSPGGALAAAPHKSSAKKFKGPVVDMRWGPVQAIITVKNKKIAGVSIVLAPDNPRSNFIQLQAVPLLRNETLKAQSAKIDTVSGATDVSDAYAQSLQAAVKAARKAKAIK